MGNPFVHVELNTIDVAKAKHFYTQLFNWKLKVMPMEGGVYTMVNVGEGTGGGLMQHPMPGAPSMWLSYALVDDIEAATKMGKRLGSTVLHIHHGVPFGLSAARDQIEVSADSGYTSAISKASSP